MIEFEVGIKRIFYKEFFFYFCRRFDLCLLLIFVGVYFYGFSMFFFF